jgi:ribosome recycling factor
MRAPDDDRIKKIARLLRRSEAHKKEVQKLHDEHLKGVDAAVKGKEAEIMEV